MEERNAIPIPEGTLLTFWAAGTILYSHRNGEMEPPAEYHYGDWWWAYTFTDDDGTLLTCFPEIVHIHGDNKGRSWISFFGARKARRLFKKDGQLKSKYRGRWWGPAVPPREIP